MNEKIKAITRFAVAAVCVVVMAVTSLYAQAIVYGTERYSGRDDIYEIDLATNTATKVFRTDLEPLVNDWPNGNAFDTVNNRLYYSTSSDPSQLYFYDFNNNQTLAGPVEGRVAGASFYDGKYYYIKEYTDDLYAVSFLADGTIASVNKLADFASNLKKFNFGDIVITSEGVFYGSAGTSPGSEFFKIDLDTFLYTKIADRPVVQLAIASDGKLYGHSAGTGEFYEVDRISGALTSVGFVTGSATNKFTDLASGPSCQPFVTDLIAGAGQNDTSKGTNVGTVTVTNDGENIYVTYEITESECYLTEVHVYLGKDLLTTAAPGQFPFKKEFEESEGYPTEYTFEISISEELDAGCKDMLFVAAHAEVCCGEGEGTYTFVQGDIATVTLWAGQTIDSGTVTVAIDGENLVVTYETKDGWELTETQLYAGTTPPSTAAPGQFPYKHSPLEPPVTTDVYTIPLSELEVGCDDTLYLAAHATVQKDLGGEYQTETGWGQGEQIDGGWAMYFWVTIPCEVVVEPECETAWGYGDDTLESLLITKKWGWYFWYPICCY